MRLPFSWKRPGPSTLLLVLFGLWIFRASLLQGGVYYKRDIHLVFHPQVEAFVRAVASGAWPVWDPSPAFGQPLLADPGAQVLYPFTWLNLLLKPWVYYSLYAALHFFIAAFGMRALGLQLGLSPPAALVAAAAFVLSGPYLSLIDLWHHYAGASWMPWVILAADRALSGGGRRLALFALAVGAQILAGSADFCAMTLLLAAWIAVARHLDLRAPRAPVNRRVVARGLLGVLLGAGLSASSWLPALELVTRSGRAHLPETTRTYWSVHPLVALETMLPGLWSALPLTGDLRARFFESREPFLASLYLGVGALGLVAAALTSSRHTLRIALGGALVLALLASLGPHTPVHALITALVPPLRILRYPVKIAVAAAFLWALLAGLGLEALREGSKRRRLAWSLAVPAGLVAALAAICFAVARLFPERLMGSVVDVVPGLSLHGTLSPALLRLLVPFLLCVATVALAFAVARKRLTTGFAGGLLACAGVLDLAAFHRSASPTAPETLYTHRPEAIAALGRSPRVYVYDYSIPGKKERYLQGRSPYVLARSPEGWSLDAASALGMQMGLAPETAGRWDLAQGFNIDLRGLHSSPVTRLARLLRDTEETPAHLRLLEAGGITHTLSYHPHPGLEPVREIEGLFERPILVQRVPMPLPRAYVVGAARMGEDDEAVARLLDSGFDPRAEVTLAGRGRAPFAARDFRGSARIVEERADRVLIEAELSAPGHVVLLDTWDPGWRAWLDTKAVTIERANLVFRAVAAPEGRHRLELVYRPPGVAMGLAASGASALMVLVLVFLRAGPEP